VRRKPSPGDFARGRDRDSCPGLNGQPPRAKPGVAGAYDRLVAMLDLNLVEDPRDVIADRRGEEVVARGLHGGLVGRGGSQRVLVPHGTGQQVVARFVADLEDHPQRRHSSSECRQHIGKRSGTTRGDDADCARKPGQGALARGREPARGFESGLEPSELFVERTETGHSRRLDIELKFAARLVDRRCRAHLDAQAILQSEAQELRLLSEQDTAYLGLLVLEQEVNVAGWCPRKVRDLAADPCQAEVALDEQAGGAHKQRNRQHRPRRRRLVHVDESITKVRQAFFCGRYVQDEI